MTERYLGASGLKVSLAGLGANNFGERVSNEVAKAIIHAALDNGVTFIDTADVYGRGGSETVLGDVLGPRRKDVILATKFGRPANPSLRNGSASRRYIIQAVEASLTRLKTDWIDLYQYHWPDPHTPIDETLRALDDLIHAGKVRYVGLSNFPAWQVVDAKWKTKVAGLEPIISSQNNYSLLDRSVEKELVPALRANGIGLLPYLPLAGGFLTGKYKRNTPLPEGSRFARLQRNATRFLKEDNFEILDRLTSFAAARGKTVADLALAWLAAQPIVASVIAGASSAEQVIANVRSLDWILTPVELTELDQLGVSGNLERAA
jgi:aryl-alcohol dehydrogenase-like predicted oxidoreductase